MEGKALVYLSDDSSGKTQYNVQSQVPLLPCIEMQLSVVAGILQTWAHLFLP